MNETSASCEQPTSGASPSTPSPASGAGPTLFDSLDGMTPAPSGPAPVRASRSARRARGKAKRTRATSGLSFSDSSPSADLQRSLESRLRAMTDVNGSPEYSLTWSRWDIGWRVPICALRASGRRTSDSGCTGWPTPKAIEPPENYETAKARQDKLKKVMAEGGQRWSGCMGLSAIAHTAMAGWPTPDTGARGPDTAEPGNWTRPSGHNRASTLQRAAWMAGWATPATTDHKGSSKPGQRRGQLSEQAEVTGPTPSSSSAETGKPVAYRLNPHFSLWLMGYPAAWGSCGARAMRLIRESRRSSSGRTAKRDT